MDWEQGHILNVVVDSFKENNCSLDEHTEEVS